MNKELETVPRSQGASLGAPGQGLPLYELLIARVMVGLKARRTTREQADENFARERDRILELAQSVSPEIGAEPVLIKRLRGMEDSSRFWSAYMTLEHLTIVNRGVHALILDLTSGRKPARVVSTADVKPRSGVGEQAVEEFAACCDTYVNDISPIPQLKTQSTWAHPWFGEINAERWHFFTGFHMALHRRQIMEILKTLKVR